VSRARRWGGRLFHRFFLGLAPDVVGLLIAQGQVSVEATAAFLRWSEGTDGDIVALTALERAADAARRTLLTALQGALATPIDQEDLYILSERCDRVVNAVRDIAAEGDALGWAPDHHAAEMARRMHAGMEELVTGFGCLRRAPDRAGDAADRSRAAARSVVRSYREAVAALFATEDAREILLGREIYRQYAEAALLLAAVADRLWYVVLAEA
jgi:uncharacterized protein Yka (UPF0111/DUF47 family)